MAGVAESQRFARLRLPVSASRGRRYPELAHPYRNDFQRDRDRIVHSRAFRRLENKTQVFPPSVSDHFRNRLTHTLEVSQIARTIAASLGLDEDFTEALALAHDIGHPPFGHSGEEALAQRMAEHGASFDHNVHALRIVERFESSYAAFPGLNLTFEVREGMAKHSRDFARGEFPELDEYRPGERPPLEAQLIDMADEIAYNTADLDDAADAALFQKADLWEACPDAYALYEPIDSMYPGAPERVRWLEFLRQLVNTLATGLITGTQANLLATQLLSVEDVRQHPVRLVGFTAHAAELNQSLKHFLHAHVYSSPSLEAERAHSAARVGWMFDHLLAHPEAMPENYRLEHAQELPHRLVCDYIAGMTDGYFHRAYLEMT
ncbi:MAG: dNTP triphosphohydrolase [Bryobacteraceae bacterium]|nr:dNTP triphosphohydrolase [Bryobacteraceae bacterium]